MKKTVIQIVVFLLLSLCVNAQRPLAYRILTVNDAYRVILDRYPEIERFDIYYSIVHGMLPMSGIPVNDNWVFFVDEEPQKGWSHNCTLYTVPRTVDDRLELTDIPIHSESLTMPPSQYNLSPYIIGNSLRNNASMQIRVHGNHETYNGDSIANEAAEHTYAMILSGGYNKYSNYGRYWNDCSYIYQTLRNKYGIPKDNITLLMADGDNPAADMIKTDWTGYQSSPLDLDFDSIADLHLAATKVNVDSVLTSYAESLTGDDHLFIYVIDHGSNDNAGNSIICLWNQQYLKDYELAAKLDSINVRSINVLLGQCYSGGFVEELEANGRVIATACSGTESSWACPDIPYDEFVYQWTNAINEIDKDSIAISSDVDINGHVTMEEAYRWACEHDRRSETPQYCSTPLSVGEDLAFNSIPEGVDLYIRDNSDDTGKEPFCGENFTMDSPDIYVRNENDGFICQKHERPYLESQYDDLFAYVKIRNRGTKDYDGNKKYYVHLFWSEPILTYTPGEFEENICNGYISYATINPIAAGDSIIKEMSFRVPADIINNTESYYTVQKKLNMCLQGYISTKKSPSDFDFDASQEEFINKMKNSNDYAAKHFSMIYVDDPFLFVRIPNTLDDSLKFRIELKCERGETLTKGNLYVRLGNKINHSWNMSNNSAYNFILPNENARWMRCSGDESIIYGLSLAARDTSGIYFKYDAMSPESSFDGNDRFTCYIYDNNNEKMIGSHTFVIINDENNDNTDEENGMLSFIKSIVINDNKLRVTMSKSFDDDMECLISCGKEILHVKRNIIARGSKEFETRVPDDIGGMITVSILKDGKPVETKKTIVK